MTLKPIRGAPPDAPIPEFPTGKPTPLDDQAARPSRHPAEPLPSAVPPPVPPPAPTRRPGPMEIRGSDHSTLTFRCFPEIPAITRSSMTISVSGEPTGNGSSQSMPAIGLTTDKAKAFLLALRDGSSSVIVADGRTGFQVEFAIGKDGPGFLVGKPGQDHTMRRFYTGRNFDVQAMAGHLLADLGP